MLQACSRRPIFVETITSENIRERSGDIKTCGKHKLPLLPYDFDSLISFAHDQKIRVCALDINEAGRYYEQYRLIVLNRDIVYSSNEQAKIKVFMHELCHWWRGDEGKQPPQIEMLIEKHVIDVARCNGWRFTNIGYGEQRFNTLQWGKEKPKPHHKGQLLTATVGE